MSLTARLKNALSELEKAAIEADRLQTERPRFAPALFKCHSPRLTDCVRELEQNLNQLEQLHSAQQAGFLAETITAQFSALQRELSTQSLRKKKSQRLNEPIPANILICMMSWRVIKIMNAGSMT